MENTKNTQAAANVMSAIVDVAQKSAPVKTEAKKKSGSVKKNKSAKPSVLTQPAALNITFAPIQARRPAAGSRLFAFTHAWLEMTGLFDGKTVDPAKLRKIVGETAIAYHKKLGNFEITPAGIGLSVHGQNFFTHRVIDGKVEQGLVDAWKEMMATGKPDGIMINNANQLVKVA